MYKVKVVELVYSLFSNKVHKNTPGGVCCTNPSCAGKLQAEKQRSLLLAGGSMESQAPPWAHSCSMKTESAVVTAVPDSTPLAALVPVKQELSCIVITVTHSIPKESWDAAEARQVILMKRLTSF